MKTLIITTSLILGIMGNMYSQTKAYVDYEFFKKIVNEVEPYRADRLIKFRTFTQYAKEPNTIILDTRSKAMYDKLHLKGAINLPFSDFTQANLAKVIPSRTTRILIYCNNNFEQGEPIFTKYFATKSISPVELNKMQDTSKFKIKPVGSHERVIDELNAPKNYFPNTTLALNIPTFINLYGYGYKNVYELEELIYTSSPLLELEGTEAGKVSKK